MSTALTGAAGSHGVTASSSVSGPARITVPSLYRRKGKGPESRIVCLTAYDFATAVLLDAAGCVDVLLVGDSLGCIVQGHETTLPVTLDEVVYHARCVSRGAQGALVVGDLPFMSYQLSPEQALAAAGRLIKEGGVAAVKLEGGVAMADTIARIVSAGIPVMGHVGLTPQSFHALGGHVRQGKTAAQRARIIEDAQVVSEAGAFGLVLECIPEDLALEVTSTVKCPTIGIGSGAVCDGEILVTHDLVGLRPGKPPPFVHQEAQLGELMIEATRRFAKRVVAPVLSQVN